ncbi:carbohydrate ABC transporter permease (plasmid) [Deinococcus metallilatus]|uniref:Carbohydrate ABC transporter permease n=1 Tax=Deinococcus metallilatus TaxID=1211322 RepID=A0AAJ5F7Y5_9DEIO|nr:carbohydrate ABC transporter permease [Deinococcus metallilatus]MBB5293515.1 raffinose/stachyose/melibiose transport system permease protein [Deinococcus metallilatus]QBY06592.1 carbohydrate ABC transporter permease [Deinococcus metallilatus]RXJ17935.1 carbohydrate ABC transporter permease [Deinococcus metallilatus]TLK32206.1 carbohydrate ABC transporter permease [Deinococcus metallilatus]GMA15265.1 sugar ABC transporter permease [Deinococcus metallilatus]
MSAPALPARRPLTARKVLHILGGLLLVVLTVVYLLPLVFMVSTSLKTPLEQSMNPLAFPARPHLDNYRNAFTQMGYLPSLLSTLIVTLGSSLLIVVSASLAAYPLARVKNRLTAVSSQLFMVGLIMPFFMIMIPLYSVMKNLHLINTYWGVMVLYTALNLPFAVFFYTSFIASLPAELEESAYIDGCNPLQSFRYIVFPLLRPVTATISMFISLGIWNDFLLPLLFLYKPEFRTMMVSVYSFVGQYGFEPTTLFAAAGLAVLPLLIVFFVMQRSIIQGITAGAIKG